MSAPSPERRPSPPHGLLVLVLWIALALLVCVVRMLSPTGDLTVLARPSPGAPGGQGPPDW